MRWCRGWERERLLGFDLETTGLDRFSDVPVSFALMDALGGSIVDLDAAMVDPGREVPMEASAIHGITTERARRDGMPLDQAITRVADTLVEASRRQVPVVGMKLDYDLTMLDAQCRRIDGRGLIERGWNGPVLDGLILDRTFDRYRRGRRTLSHLCAHYGVPMVMAHDAAADAEAAIGVVLALSRAFPRLGHWEPGDLHRAQVAWHRRWATSYDAWRRSREMPPLDPRDYVWPIADEVTASQWT